MSGVSDAVLRGADTINYHTLGVVSVGQVACAIGGVTYFGKFARRCISGDAPAEQSSFTVNKRGKC